MKCPKCKIVSINIWQKIFGRCDLCFLEGYKKWKENRKGGKKNGRIKKHNKKTTRHKSKLRV